MPQKQSVLERVKKIDKTSWDSRVSASLFIDIHKKSHPDAIYSLRRETNDKTIHLLDVYLAVSDPTEYEFAMLAFGSVRRWEKCKNSYWGAEVFLDYAKELAIKIKSDAVLGIIEMSNDSEIKETTRLTALKWIVSSNFVPKEKPTAKIKEAERKRVRNDIASDIERLGLKVIK